MVSRVQQLQWAIEFLPIRWARASDPISRRRDLHVARGLNYHERLYDFLAPRREAARIDEAKNTVVVGRAVEPERKPGPKRPLIIAIAAALLFLLACFVVLVREIIRRKKQDPVEAQGQATVNQYLGSSF
jgi:hypothetical protein